MTFHKNIYSWIVDDTEHKLGDDNPDLPKNFLTLVVIHLFSKLASQLANTKTTLPWLASSLGVPAFIIGLFVPIRESLSLIPQVVFAGLIEHYPKQRLYLLLSLLGQGISIFLLVVLTLDLSGWVAGVIMLVCISLFALSRCATSIVSKDVLGLLIVQSQRGQLTGTSASAAGFFVLIVGLCMALGVLNIKDSAVWLLVASAIFWVLAAGVCTVLSQPQDKSNHKEPLSSKVASFFKTLKDTSSLKYFIYTRALMVGSALSAPYILLMSKTDTDGVQNMGSLGIFIMVSGLASLISARIWGRFADINSRNMMRLTALLTAIICAFAAGLSFVSDQQSLWVVALVFFSLSVIHQGVRIARKTYIVDLASDDQRLRFVSLSNTATGIMIFLIGGLTAAIAQWSIAAVLLTLSVMALMAIALTFKLPKIDT